MNQITHKQALKWIDRRLDGLLTEKQLQLLVEHLHSCDTCRVYATEMGSLPAHLQNEFHARWDDNPGPSQNVMEQVTSKARRIPMANRLSAGIKFFAAAAALVALGFFISLVISQLQNITPATIETSPGIDLPRAEDRLLVFASTQNGNSDIYTMRADGSELTNLTKDPDYDGNPFWSPDGKQIAFMSGRSGFAQIYLMDADGSNLTQLTNGESNSNLDINGPSPWSPDGTKVIFSNKLLEEHPWKLYTLNVNDKTSTLLTNEPGRYLSPSWSPDGEHIAFLYYESETRPLARHLFVVDKDGNNLTELTESLGIDETGISLDLNYFWSQDGTSVFFTAASTPETTVYQAGLDGSLTVMAKVSGQSLVDWWDGTTLLQEEDFRTLTWLRSDGSQATLELCPSSDQVSGLAHKRSDNGNLFFGTNCSATGWMFYWANPDGSTTDQLLNLGIPARNESLLKTTWSPDDRFIAFNTMDDSPAVTFTLYIVDAAKAREDPSTQPLKMTRSFGLSWQPVIRDRVVEEEPTPKPEQTSSDGNLLAFSFEQNGDFDIYSMRPDGSELTNLTNDPGQEDLNPFWSPDGKYIAFERERHIFRMDADGSNVIQLTGGEATHRIGNKAGMDSGSWSPDGSKLIFFQSDPGASKWTPYTMDADGENKQPLVHEPDNYSSPAWSSDGQHIAFLRIDVINSDGPRLYLVDSDGSNLREVTEFLLGSESLWSYEDYYWSQDGRSIFFIAWRHLDEGQDQWIAYEFSLEDSQLIEKAVSSTPMGNWWEGTSFITGWADDREAPITWLRPDGTYNTLKPFEKCEPVEETQYGYTYQRSARGNLVIAAKCPNGDWWLYWANPDGTMIKQLLDSPISAQDSDVLGFTWSPDDKFIAFNVASNSLTEMYVLNVEAALSDPSVQPLKITVARGLLFYNPSWQPVP
jgi:Tol biopolymer transport system component